MRTASHVERQGGTPRAKGLAAKKGSSDLLVSVTVLRDERLENVENLFLLSARQSGDRFKELTGFAAWSHDAARLVFAKKFLDCDAKGFGHWDQDV